MKYPYIKILLILCLLTSYSFSQSHPIWQKVFPSPWGTPGYASGGGIAPADDGNFYFSNRGSIGPHGTQIIKINPYGDTIWTRFIDSVLCYTGISSGDGGYVVTGDNMRDQPRRGNYTVKINSSGNIIWNRIYDSIPSTCWNITRTENGIYVICGRADYYYGLIYTLDSSGNLIWRHLYPSQNYKIFYAISGAHNGGYIAAGYYDTSIYDPGGAIISRVDEHGEIIWERIFYYNTYHFSRFTSIIKINAGYILLPFDYKDTTIKKSRAQIVKIDTSGNITYLHTIPDDTNKFVLAGHMNIINPNRYLIYGSMHDYVYDTASARTYITDSLGNVLKKGLFKESQNSAFDKCFVVNENDFIFIGTSDYLQPNEYYNTYVVRTDTNFHAPPIGIKTEIGNVPVDFQLWQNYPNPFNPATTIRYDLPKSANVSIKVYDLLGREIYSVNEFKLAGSYSFRFDGSNYASGVYFYRIEEGSFTAVKKMVLVK